jgi:glycosyltransferase involved in cell wall biosynthesis
MNIGYDAKRYYHNNTGLGNYSRTLIEGLARFYPEHHYYLFNPERNNRIVNIRDAHVHEILPGDFVSRLFPATWRSSRVKKEFKRLRIDIYHGLSHEIPLGIPSTTIPTVVTMHDLIFERYPEQFSKIDVQIFRKKFKYACRFSNRIIAISKQTKEDLVQMYGIDEGRIDICYQSCHPAYGQEADAISKKRVKEKYGLPDTYFLYVGSITERKNLLNICRALDLLKDSVHVPLVVIGEGRGYKSKVQEYLHRQGIEKKVIFLSERAGVSSDPTFQMPSTFAVIYQMALAMVYPSYFEGFGIPILEALWSGIPVITSNISSMPEAGGEAAYYVDPQKPEEIAYAMKLIYEDEVLRDSMIQKGFVHAQQFTLQKCSERVMNVYKKIT